MTGTTKKKIIFRQDFTFSIFPIIPLLWLKKSQIKRKRSQTLLFLGHCSLIKNKKQTAVINILNLHIFVSSAKHRHCEKTLKSSGKGVIHGKLLRHTNKVSLRFLLLTHHMKHSLLGTRKVISSIITRTFFVTRSKQPMTIGTNRICISIERQYAFHDNSRQLQENSLRRFAFVAVFDACDNCSPIDKLAFSFLLCDKFKTYFLSMPQLSKYVSIPPNERFPKGASNQGPEGGYSRKFWIGVCRKGSCTLTLFKD